MGSRLTILANSYFCVRLDPDARIVHFCDACPKSGQMRSSRSPNQCLIGGYLPCPQCSERFHRGEGTASIYWCERWNDGPFAWYYEHALTIAEDDRDDYRDY